MKGSDVAVGGVSKFFGGFRALNDVSLEIRKGEFFSLLGPSGCGKTTLLRILAGFEQPDGGTVAFDGRDVLSAPPNRRQTNTVFQNYALFPHLSVFENVAFSMRLRKAPKGEVEAKVGEYLRLVQLESQAGKKPAQLSGGQKQRVAIARALINEPSVLLLDEPLSALDAKLRHRMLIELDEIHDKIGITFIYVTHDQQEALSVSDRIAVMDQGNVLQVGPPQEIYESPKTDFVARFIGETNLFDATVISAEKMEREPAERMAVLETRELGRIRVTTVDEASAGQRVSFTVRPEKIVISKDRPATKRGDINLFRGTVDEMIYSGFQTKFYVRAEAGADDQVGGAQMGGALVQVIKQHANYSDEGPGIRWGDRVFLSWTADDGYVVEAKS